MRGPGELRDEDVTADDRLDEREQDADSERERDVAAALEEALSEDD